MKVLGVTFNVTVKLSLLPIVTAPVAAQENSAPPVGEAVQLNVPELLSKSSILDAPNVYVAPEGRVSEKIFFVSAKIAFPPPLFLTVIVHTKGVPSIAWPPTILLVFVTTKSGLSEIDVAVSVLVFVVPIVAVATLVT